LDDNPLFCIVSHISSLAFEDKAFGIPELVPEQLFALKARNGWSQPIPWKKDKLDVPIFRRAIKTNQGVYTSKEHSLPYQQYHGWVVRLGEALDFVDALTTYCLRQNLGNAINGKNLHSAGCHRDRSPGLGDTDRLLDDPNSNAAVRNLVMDHATGSRIFERNYLSRRIRYSTQDAFWGRPTDHESAKAASRIRRLRDPNRPRKLNSAQKQDVRQSHQVLELITVRDRLRMHIEEEFGVVKMAEGEPIYNDYQTVRRRLDSAIRSEERALLKRVQEEYDAVAPILAIQQQLNGEVSDDEDDPSQIEMVEIRVAERRQIAQFALNDPSTFTDRKGFSLHVQFTIDMIALCQRRERPRPRTHRPRAVTPIKTDDDPPPLAKSEPEIKRDGPLKCQGFQCLFCLVQGLPSEDCNTASKYSLRRHIQRFHPWDYCSDEPIRCPDHMCADLVFTGEMAYKAHATLIHQFFL
jgi:hypothetical protein